MRKGWWRRHKDGSDKGGGGMRSGEGGGGQGEKGGGEGDWRGAGKASEEREGGRFEPFSTSIGEALGAAAREAGLRRLSGVGSGGVRR